MVPAQKLLVLSLQNNAPSYDILLQLPKHHDKPCVQQYLQFDNARTRLLNFSISKSLCTFLAIFSVSIPFFSKDSPYCDAYVFHKFVIEHNIMPH